MNASSSRFAMMAGFVCLSALLPQAPFGLQAQGQMQQYRMRVAKANAEPFKVEVQPTQQGVRPGASTVIRIELRNAANQPVNAVEPTTLEIKAKSPSRPEQAQKVVIPANANSANITLTPREAGIWKLEAREVNDHLKSGSNFLMVSSPEGARPPAAAAPRERRPMRRKTAPPQASPTPRAFLSRPHLILAAYEYEPPQDALPTQPAQQAGIILRVSGEGDGKVRADGISAARVSVFLMALHREPVRVWLSVSHGQLKQPFVTILPGQFVAEVDWTSTTPLSQAKVSISQTSPRIAGYELASATVDFVDPIVAISFANPPARINIVEKTTLAVRFVDKNATPIPAHSPLLYRFSANSGKLRLAPATDQTKPGSMDFSTDITPSALGTVTLEAAVEGLQPVRQSIEITGTLLLLFCALGGAAGGLVNHFDRKQKGLLASLLTAVIVSLPITWLYVWVGLPNLNAAFLHNQLSAVMVAIIGGAAGASGLKTAAKQFGLELFEFATADELAKGKSAGGMD
jgi:hypothetical protein